MIWSTLAAPSDHRLVLRATAMQNGDLAVVKEVTILVQLEEP